jgi:hypothetical protein
MLDEGLYRPDGASIARSVRNLARQARKVLAHPADESRARELFDAIERLERQIGPAGNSKDLGRWLANLRRRVESRLPAAV